MDEITLADVIEINITMYSMWLCRKVKKKKKSDAGKLSCDDCCPSLDGVIAFNALDFFGFNFRLPPARPSSRSEQSPDVKIISKGEGGRGSVKRTL